MQKCFVETRETVHEIQDVHDVEISDGALYVKSPSFVRVFAAGAWTSSLTVAAETEIDREEAFGWS